MKKSTSLLTLVLTVMLLAVWAGSALAQFPQRPIRLVVHTSPGGAIDVFARKFLEVAAKHTDATFVVVNQPGAGGLVQMRELLSARPDGYTIGPTTKSHIGRIVSSRAEGSGAVDPFDFTWLAMMVDDPECLIVNRNTSIRTWEQIKADALAKGGSQIWVGPAAGGNDHIYAMKVWDSTGIEARWVPYRSGGDAMAALMGEHGVVYVGNPQDVIGRPDLEVAVVSSTERLWGDFADVPTWRELGYEGLDYDNLWRGFKVRKGIPDDARAFYDDLFEKVNNDPDWQKWNRDMYANPLFLGEEEFTEIVRREVEDFTARLTQLGIIEP